MTRGEKIFSVVIRCVFILAFGAFLFASIHHVGVFFQNFEPPTQDGSVSWGSYALALSVDGTALMLTIGMMFFNKRMPMYAKFMVWGFIVLLTIFSWVVNWEYATAYQSSELTTNIDPMWKNINPILASSFAFLNLAYSIVSEFFGTKEKTEDELRAELDGLTGERARLQREIQDAKSQGPDLVDRLKSQALRVKKAAGEIMKEEAGQEAQRNVHDKFAVPDNTSNTIDTSIIEIRNQPNPQQIPGSNVPALPAPEEKLEVDKLDLTIETMKNNPVITDEELAEVLGLRRPASARFWRLQAQKILNINPEKDDEEIDEETGEDPNEILNFSGKDAGKTRKMIVKTVESDNDTRSKIIDILKRCREEGRKPTQQDIANELKIARVTVNRHMKTIQLVD